MALTLMLLLPLLGAIALIAIPGDESPVERAIALWTSVLTAVLAVVVVAGRHEVDVAWIRSLGIRWHFAVDGISAALVLLTALLTVAVVVHTLAGRIPPGGSGSTFLGCILLVETGALATFLARDAILFFISFEVVLVPMWVLIRSFGDDHVPDERRSDAAGRFVLFTVLGSTLMLVGILFLVHHQGTSDLTELARLHGDGISRSLETTIAAILLLGLGIKVPLWPVHTWLPPAHTVAPTAGSVLLAAVLLKMGTYGIVRLVVATVPNGLATLSPVLAILGVVGILWGGLACLVERDLKRLIAYSSVAHMGFVVLALASGSDTGLQAALLGNIAHGMVAALLFFVVGDLKEQWGSADLRTVRIGLRDRASRFGVVLLIGLGAALGLPGLVSFWGEFLALYATWSPAADRPVTLMRICVVLGAAGLALAAAYSLRVARLVWSGEAGGAAVGASAPSHAGGQVAGGSRPGSGGGRHSGGAGRPGSAVGAATPVTGTSVATGLTGATEAGPGPEIAPEAGGVVDVRGARWAVMLTLAVAVVVLGVLPQLLLGLSGADAVRLITGGGVP
jgi:NADH-quinone oxidoreductase subunit M